ncbi:MAG: hypothetical protein GY943_33640 [Chloroflexi bacterium]|nr:hypothetical protein [Chloroflexota bacterium]
MADGEVYINDLLLSELYIAAAATYSGNWQMGEDEYFVLGDNRNSSSDSHVWENLAAEFIIGKVINVCETDTPEKCTDIPETVCENDS